MDNRRKVSQFKLDGTFVKEYDSIANAARVMGCNESTIRRAINLERRSFGFVWKFNDEYNSGKVIWKESRRVGKNITNKPKILLLDIETAPIKAYVWRLWKQDISLPQIISDWFMLTWSAKWLGESTILSERLTGDEAKSENDKRIVKKLWSLLDDADMVIAHNGNTFDIPKINSRFLVTGLSSPSSYKQIDTKIIAKNQFGFSSNKLQHLANLLGIEGKYDTDFELWVKCLQGDEESLEYMELYNKHDVEVLEDVFIKLRPFAKGLPNLDLYFDDNLPHCPSCGSQNLMIEVDKKFYTQAVQYQLYRCKDCGSLSRAKQGDKFINKKVISAIPR